MIDNKRPTQTKYLSVDDYLVYKKIEKENWFFSDEMNKFLKEHDLPMTNELSKYNLRVYMENSVQIHINNMDDIKNVNINFH
jgi:O-glycosyl hydrolase